MNYPLKQSINIICITLFFLFFITAIIHSVSIGYSIPHLALASGHLAISIGFMNTYYINEIRKELYDKGVL